MEDYQLRVIQEKNNLSVKIIKLTGFLYSTASDNLLNQQRILMQEQLKIMTEYNIILQKRIDLFI